MTQLFRLSTQTIEPSQEMRSLGMQPAAGAYVSFEGWVRNHHAGRSVQHLAYEAHPVLALVAAEQILREVAAQHELTALACVHRIGLLQVGEVAVWVGVCAAHRDVAFVACRQIIDRIKAEVPIWKHETYTNNEKTWVGADLVKPI